MCEVSDKIKFCTCKASSTDRLKNYWVFYRYDKDRFISIVGEYFLPVITNEEMVVHNEEILLKRVNEPDAFDVNLKPKNRDRLEIVLTCNEHFGGNLHLGFEFKKGKWAPCEYQVFEWTDKHTESSFGKIK